MFYTINENFVDNFFNDIYTSKRTKTNYSNFDAEVLEDGKQKVTINNYRNQISFHSKINKIGFGGIIDNYFEKIVKIKSNSSILLYGPSGIGKNYTANFIHMTLSSNNPDTFINMNENLMNENDLLKFSSIKPPNTKAKINGGIGKS